MGRPNPVPHPLPCPPAPRQVALQFPDELLADAVAVAAQMEAATGAEMYVLGDTTYGRWVRGRGVGASRGSSTGRNGAARSLPGGAEGRSCPS